MKVRGNRVYLLRPNFKNYDFTLDPKTQRELDDEELSKFDRLEVYAVGAIVNVSSVASVSQNLDDIKIGDMVYVDPKDLKLAVHLKIDDKFIMSVSGSAIMHIW